jgi:hypothetical protein
MIPRDQLPEDAADWSAVSVSLPRLASDSASSCPRTTDEIFEYVKLESADSDDSASSRLEFRRTAKVLDSQFWLWTYTNEDGETAFVTCQLDPNGSTCVGLASPNGLNDEQFILAEYYDEVYWS